MFGDHANFVWCLQGELRMILMRHIDRNKPLMRCNMYGNKILQKLDL